MTYSIENIRNVVQDDEGIALSCRTNGMPIMESRGHWHISAGSWAFR